MSGSERKGIQLGQCGFWSELGAKERSVAALASASFFDMVIWRFASKSAVDALRKRNDFLASLQKHAGSMSDDVNAARVVFTELVANVVLHAPGPIAITLEVTDSYAVLTVADSGPGFVFAPALPSDPLSNGGRGLFLVSRLAAAVSVRRLDGVGTRVSALLPVRILRTDC